MKILAWFIIIINLENRFLLLFIFRSYAFLFFSFSESTFRFWFFEWFSRSLSHRLSDRNSWSCPFKAFIFVLNNTSYWYLQILHWVDLDYVEILQPHLIKMKHLYYLRILLSFDPKSFLVLFSQAEFCIPITSSRVLKRWVNIYIYFT